KITGIDSRSVVAASAIVPRPRGGFAKKRVSVKRVRRAARLGKLRVRFARSSRSGRKGVAHAALRTGQSKVTVVTHGGRGDTKPPETSITAGPANSTTSTTAQFTFTGTDAGGVAGFECNLDGAGWSSCSSPKAYNGLSVGSHTFSVRARDNAGNV